MVFSYKYSIHLFYTALLLVLAVVLASCKEKGNEPLVDGKENEARHLFSQARQSQSRGNYMEAVAQYDRCVRSVTGVTGHPDSLIILASDAMVQMMNAYQSAGKPEVCVGYFRQMAQRPSPFVRRYCMRDVHVLLAYALSRTDREREAAEVMDRALRMPLAVASHDRLFRDYAYAAVVYYCLPNRQDDAAKCGRKAMAEARLCHNPSGVQWVSALLGGLYRRTGDIDNAIDMYNESYTLAHEKGDTLGMANARNCMGDLLLYWDLADYAEDYTTQAVAMADQLGKVNPMVLTNIYVNHAKVKSNLGQRDSAFIYLGKARRCCASLPYNSGHSDIDLELARLLVGRGQTAGEGVRLLETVARKATAGIRARAYYELARIYIDRHDAPRADHALTEMYATLTQGNSPVIIVNAYEMAIRYYLSKGDKEKVNLFVKAKYESDQNNGYTAKLNKMANTVVKFKTRQKEDEIRLLEVVAEKRVQAIVTLGVFLLLVIVGFLVVQGYSHKMARLRQRLVESQLKNLSDQIATLTIDKENMRSKLETMRMADMKYGNLSPELLKEDGEETFRLHFGKLYPQFMSNLRKRFPTVSRREELLCMLIALDQDTNQIERILCVAHNSVNVARYRLRTKMGLNKTDSLEDTVKDILRQSDV